MKVSIVVAYDQDRSIGIDNKLPWHIPEDLKHFKKITLGKPVVMGRKTYVSLGQPLPHRKNIVISRDPSSIPNAQDGDVEVFDDFELALNEAKRSAGEMGVEEVMVIGGAKVFELAMKVADQMYITEIRQHYNADVKFPETDMTDWVEESSKEMKANGDVPSIVFRSYKRAAASGKSQPLVAAE